VPGSISRELARSWLRPLAPGADHRLTLVCLPHAGGGANAFASWPALLPAEVELVAVQLPGRETRLREAPLTGFDQVVEAVAGAIAAEVRLPYALYGHSMGALLAFEVARRTESRRPVHLFVAGCRAPQLAPAGRRRHALPQAELVQWLRELEGTAGEVAAHAELMRLIMPALRADLTLTDAYRYQAGRPLPVDLTAFGGESDPEAPPATLPPWSRETANRFSLHLFPGGHFFVVGARARLLRVMAEELEPALAGASVLS
jgi:surfactin synthase thioesterase subunit